MMKSSQIFTEAANILQRQLHNSNWWYDGCCAAIYWAAVERDERREHTDCLVREEIARKLFIHLFKPKSKSRHDFWFGHPRDGSNKIRIKRQNHRITALLLAAEYAKSLGE